MKIQNVRETSASFADAWQEAQDNLEPVFVNVKPFADDRGWSLMNVMQGVMTEQGQINYSLMYPDVIKAWHRHYLQTDFWMCPMGHLKVGIHHEEENRTWQIVIGQMRPGVLVIPPPLWHGGATVGHEPAGLLYYVTHSYNPQKPDEDRRAFDSIDGFPWQVQHK